MKPDLHEYIAQLSIDPACPIPPTALQVLIPGLWKDAMQLVGPKDHRVLGVDQAQDLFHDALLRLCTPGALDGYDPNSGKYAAYVRRVGKNCMRETAAQMKGSIAVPRSTRQRTVAALDALDEYGDRTVQRSEWEANGRRMAARRKTLRDVTGEGFTSNTLFRALEALQPPVEFSDEDTDVDDPTAGSPVCPGWAKQMVDEAMIHLKPQDQKALKHWYGLDGHEQCASYDELAEVLLCAKSTAHDRVNRAQRKMRASIENHPHFGRYRR